MKKYLTFLLYFLICTYNLFAQENYQPIIEQPNKEWITHFSSWTISGPLKFYLGEDTIIQNKKYYKLYRSFVNNLDTSTPPLCLGILTEQNRKIYFRPQFIGETAPINIDFLLYDFSLGKGDSIRLQTIPLSDQYTFSVKDIEIVLINGKERKQWILESINNNTKIKWIEGIGSLHGLFDNGLQGGADAYSILIAVNTNRQNLYCNSDYDSTKQYCIPTEEQSEVTAIFPVTEDNILQFQVYPNIFAQTTTLQFVLPETTMTSLHIYNSQGQKIQTIFSNEMLPEGQHQPQLQLTNVAEGMYYAVLFLNGTTVKVHKMMLIN